MCVSGCADVMCKRMAMAFSALDGIEGEHQEHEDKGQGQPTARPSRSVSEGQGSPAEAWLPLSFNMHVPVVEIGRM